MTNRSQRQFIANIRRALGKSPQTPPRPDLFHIRPKDLDARLQGYIDKSTERQEELLEELIMRAEAVQMQVAVVADNVEAANVIRKLALTASPEWGSEKRIAAWHHPHIDALDLAAHLAGDNIPVTVTRTEKTQDPAGELVRLRKDIEAAYIGITSADFVVAHTATMVMKSRPSQFRSVSLLPSIHVCVVAQDQIVADLEELYTRLQWDPDHKGEGLTNCMTLISAPSKTGDIELVMVNGAHGPREVHLIVISE